MGLLRIVALVFLPFAGGYYLSYLYRSTNAMIAPDLISEIGLTAGELGLMTAAYPLAFGLFQAPLGLLLDRFGPRRVQTVLLTLAALGAIGFGLGQDMTSLTLSRALIGIGVSGGLMAGFKAVTMWFPERRWPLANGCYLAAGGFGALSATVPLEFALTFADRRQVYLGLGGVNVVVAGLVWWLVPECAAGSEGSSLRDHVVVAGLVWWLVARPGARAARYVTSLPAWRGSTAIACSGVSRRSASPPSAPLSRSRGFGPGPGSPTSSGFPATVSRPISSSPRRCWWAAPS